MLPQSEIESFSMKRSTVVATSKYLVAIPLMVTENIVTKPASRRGFTTLGKHVKSLNRIDLACWIMTHTFTLVNQPTVGLIMD